MIFAPARSRLPGTVFAIGEAMVVLLSLLVVIPFLLARAGMLNANTMSQSADALSILLAIVPSVLCCG
jgi:hypothetical protein